MSKRARSNSNETSNDDLRKTDNVEITCMNPPCLKSPPCFQTYSEYELHILNYHTFICKDCHKKFPSNNLLNVHIEENHDPFFSIKKERGMKVYKCFQFSSNSEQGCKKICSDRKKRRLHMIDKHGYPKDFNFRIIDQGI